MKQESPLRKRLIAYSQQSVEQLRRDWDITDHGLTEEQVRQRRERYGNNQLADHHADTVLYRLRRAVVSPFSMILLVLATITFVTDVLMTGSAPRNTTSVIIMLVMLAMSSAVRFVQELRAKQIADHLTHLVASTVKVRRDGLWVELPAEELVVGDRVSLSAGDRVPADIRLTSAKDLFVSQSVISGESAILEKTIEPLAEPPVRTGDYRNTLFMGSAVTGGSGEGVVLAVGGDTVYGSIAQVENPRKNGFDTGANAISKVLIRFMAVLTPVVFVACGLTKHEWLTAFLFALSVAVGLTPELLPMVVNACLAKGGAAMGSKQTVVRNINAMQGFGSMDVLCVDKTGTLTGDTVALEYYMDVLGNESETVLEYAYLNSLYHTGVQNHLDRAILKSREMPGRAFDALEAAHPCLDERPFDYDRRLASVVVRRNGQPFLLVKGSVEDVCACCAQAEYRGHCSAMDAEGRRAVHDVVDDMTEDGMKVLAIACKPLDHETLLPSDEQGLTLVGYLAFFDAPKKSAASAITALQKRRISVRVLTGDQLVVAKSICRRLGISTADALTGTELEALSEDERIPRIEKTTVFAELTPRQKAMIVETLQQSGHTVGFLGDGMNDLPAIVEADVGVSVDTAAEAVKEAADVILLKKDLNVLEEGVLEGRRAFANMSKYIKITASSNFGNIVSVVLASVLLPFFPMTSIQLLLLNLLYDILCLVLPWDRVDDDVLSQPAEWNGKTLGRFMIYFGPVSSVFDVITFLFLFFSLCPAVCGGGFASLDAPGQARFIALFQTGWFLESMWTQVLILHLLRTRHLPLLQSKPAFPVTLVTLVGVMLFTALTFTQLGALIGLTALPAGYFAFLALTVTGYLLLITLAKSHYVRRHRKLI